MKYLLIAALTLSAFVYADQNLNIKGPDDDQNDLVETGLNSTVNKFSAEELKDIRLIAEARGWTIQEAKAQTRTTIKLGRLANHLATNNSDVYVGAELSESPGGIPTIYIKGSVNSDFHSLISTGGIDGGVNIIDSQPYSLLELEEREQRVHSMLVDEGYQDIMSSFDIAREGHIDVVITYPAEADLAAKTASDLMGNISDDFSSTDVTITFQHDPVGDDFTAYGGMTMRDGGRAECTSGWSVADRYGRRGVTTAGHCSGIDQIQHGSDVHIAPYRHQHLGTYGDIEWHLTDQHETADFYASAYSVRSVSSVEPVYSTVRGESICFYGRFSNRRDCSFDVYQTSMSCTVSGVTSSKLVQMTGNSAIGGDSGGGWSWGSRAYGSVKGICGGRAVFSHAGYYPNALGVWVMTK